MSDPVSERVRGLLARALALVLPVCAMCAGCGGGGPLLHPARTLNAGEVRAAGGLSANFAPAGLGTALNAARAETPQPNADGQVTIPTDATYAKGAFIAAVVAPGVAPFAAGRAGLGSQLEIGLSYSGRAARLDLRRSFDWDKVSLSIGGGLSYIFYGDVAGASLPEVDVNSVQGFGADIPVLIGWQSSARLFMVWAGGRVGFDHVGISDTDPQQFMSTPNLGELSATRFYGGGLVGLAAGFRHLHVALEFDASYQTISGSFFGTSTNVGGLSLSPGAALWVDF
jgi:hypothetical protein